LKSSSLKSKLIGLPRLIQKSSRFSGNDFETHDKNQIPTDPQSNIISQSSVTATEDGYSANFQKIVEGFQSPKAQAEYYWLPEEKVPLFEASHVNKMKSHQYYNHHKTHFFESDKKFKLKLTANQYPSWRTCGLIFFTGSGPEIAAKQLLCDICLNIAERKVIEKKSSSCKRISLKF
jgi:hypothetical protein